MRLEPRGDGAHDHDHQHEDAERDERETGDLDGAVAAGDLGPSRLPPPDEMPGLAVGAQVGDLLRAVGVVVRDLRYVLSCDAAHLARAGLGQLGTVGGCRIHGPDANCVPPAPGEH